LVVGGSLSRGAAELVSYAESSQAVAGLLQIDNINNSGADAVDRLAGLEVDG